MGSTKLPLWILAICLAAAAPLSACGDSGATGPDPGIDADSALAAESEAGDLAIHDAQAEVQPDTGGDAEAGASDTDGGGDPDPDADSGTDAVAEIADAPGADDPSQTDAEPEIAADTEIAAQPDGAADAETAVDTPVAADLGPDLPPPPTIAEMCFSDILPEGATSVGPQYDALNPVVAKHCLGTNHQDITGVQQVVVLGDSVAQGTPNDKHLLAVDNSHFWRNLFAEWAAVEFKLDRGNPIDWGLWKTYQYTGVPGRTESGDFKNCSKWGARTDDLLEGGGQIAQCFPSGGSDKRTLVVMTMGGNDIAKIQQTGAEATPAEIAAGYPAAWALAETTVGYLRDALVWLKDPVRFPNGSYVIFANPYEFTDGTGAIDACSPQAIEIPGVITIDLSAFDIPIASLGGFGAWEKPEVQEAIVIWLLEQYTALAVETQTDVLWLLENFCGHGYVATGPDADTQNRCYRGPNAALWFDITCIHPSDAGHYAIYDMFRAAVTE
jgi:lysophospholipase L1-like esterase